MALIKCSCCGHMVSDKGTKCPKCGTPIKRGEPTASIVKEEKVVAAVESPKTEVPRGNIPAIEKPIEVNAPIEDVDEPQKSKKGIIALLCSVAVIAAIIGAYFFLGNKRMAAYEKQDNPTYSEELVKYAENGDAVAQCDLGICYAKGNGIAQNEQEAFKWFGLSAEQGDARGQRNYGRCFIEGFGVEKNLEEGFKWFLLSANQNDAEAQTYVGFCYAQGIGVSQNYGEAFKWFKLSAEQGNSSGMFYLGHFYNEGLGVSQNVEEAIKWWEKAAKQGNTEAIQALTQFEKSENVDSLSSESINETICNEYERLLDENRASQGDCEYFLYDIDNDDIPELWMRVGSYEANYRLLVYTYKNGIKQLYEDGAGHSYFCMGTNYILQVWGHMGEASWSKLTYDGTKIVAKTIFEEDIRDSESDYKKPQEPEIDFHPSTDKQPIYDVFAVE